MLLLPPEQALDQGLEAVIAAIANLLVLTHEVGHGCPVIVGQLGLAVEEDVPVEPFGPGVVRSIIESPLESIFF